MKVLVFLKEVVDTRVQVEYDEHTGRLKPDWNVSELNPHDRSALLMALKLKSIERDTRITAIHMGPPRGDRLLRIGLALGCDEGLRLWDDELPAELIPAAKAFIFGRLALVLGFDILLCGAKSADSGNEQIGTILASHLKTPCILSAVDLEVQRNNERRILATRMLALGYRQRIRSPLPAVITVEDHTTQEGYPSLPVLLDVMDRRITVVDLAEIGITAQAVKRINSSLSVGSLQVPRPKLKHVQSPDASLPAFERIGKLVEGTLRPREGRVVNADADAVAAEIFATLLREGWLDHLRGSS